jgi:hypothetical protein
MVVTPMNLKLARLPLVLLASCSVDIAEPLPTYTSAATAISEVVIKEVPVEKIVKVEVTAVPLAT